MFELKVINARESEFFDSSIDTNSGFVIEVTESAGSIGVTPVDVLRGYVKTDDGESTMYFKTRVMAEKTAEGMASTFSDLYKYVPRKPSKCEPTNPMEIEECRIAKANFMMKDFLGLKSAVFDYSDPDDAEMGKRDIFCEDVMLGITLLDDGKFLVYKTIYFPGTMYARNGDPGDPPDWDMKELETYETFDKALAGLCEYFLKSKMEDYWEYEMTFEHEWSDDKEV